MGSFLCKCGVTVALKSGDETGTAILIESRFLMHAMPKIVADLEAIAATAFVKKNDAQLDMILTAIDMASTGVIKCENCQRVWIENKTIGKYEAFVKEKMW